MSLALQNMHGYGVLPYGAGKRGYDILGTDYYWYGNKQGDYDDSNCIEGEDDDNTTSFAFDSQTTSWGRIHVLMNVDTPPVANPFIPKCCIQVEKDQVPATLSGLSMYVCRFWLFHCHGMLVASKST
jgi:hypothetical protein